MQEEEEHFQKILQEGKTPPRVPPPVGSTPKKRLHKLPLNRSPSSPVPDGLKGYIEASVEEIIQRAKEKAAQTSLSPSPTGSLSNATPPPPVRAPQHTTLREHSLIPAKESSRSRSRSPIQKLEDTWSERHSEKAQIPNSSGGRLQIGHWDQVRPRDRTSEERPDLRDPGRERGHSLVKWAREKEEEKKTLRDDKTPPRQSPRGRSSASSTSPLVLTPWRWVSTEQQQEIHAHMPVLDRASLELTSRNAPPTLVSTLSGSGNSGARVAPEDTTVPCSRERESLGGQSRERDESRSPNRQMIEDARLEDRQDRLDWTRERVQELERELETALRERDDARLRQRETSAKLIHTEHELRSTSLLLQSKTVETETLLSEVERLEARHTNLLVELNSAQESHADETRKRDKAHRAEMDALKETHAAILQELEKAEERDGVREGSNENENERNSSEVTQSPTTCDDEAREEVLHGQMQARVQAEIDQKVAVSSSQSISKNAMRSIHNINKKVGSLDEKVKDISGANDIVSQASDQPRAQTEALARERASIVDRNGVDVDNKDSSKVGPKVKPGDERVKPGDERDSDANQGQLEPVNWEARGPEDCEGGVQETNADRKSGNSRSDDESIVSKQQNTDQRCEDEDDSGWRDHNPEEEQEREVERTKTEARIEKLRSALSASLEKSNQVMARMHLVDKQRQAAEQDRLSTLFDLEQTRWSLAARDEEMFEKEEEVSTLRERVEKLEAILEGKQGTLESYEILRERRVANVDELVKSPPAKRGSILARQHREASLVATERRQLWRDQVDLTNAAAASDNVTKKEMEVLRVKLNGLSTEMALAEAEQRASALLMDTHKAVETEQKVKQDAEKLLSVEITEQEERFAAELTAKEERIKQKDDELSTAEEKAKETVSILQSKEAALVWKDKSQALTNLGNILYRQSAMHFSAVIERSKEVWASNTRLSTMKVQSKQGRQSMAIRLITVSLTRILYKEQSGAISNFKINHLQSLSAASRGHFEARVKDVTEELNVTTAQLEAMH